MKRRKLILTKPAVADLDGIYDYIAADNASAAERYTRKIVGRLQKLARTGVTGVSRSHIRPGLRMHAIDKYCVYFRIDDTSFLVVRVLHSARDAEAVFRQDET